jgi:hypothetical protein
MARTRPWPGEQMFVGLVAGGRLRGRWWRSLDRLGFFLLDFYRLEAVEAAYLLIRHPERLQGTPQLGNAASLAFARPLV